MCVFTWESRHSSQSVQRGGRGTFLVPALGAGACIRRGRGSRVVEGRVGNMQIRSFTFLWPSLGVTWRGAITGGSGGMAGPTACGELWWRVRVHRGAVIWAGMSWLRFPLRTRGGQERRASGRLQQTFSSLCAHVYLVFSGQGGQLDVGSAGLGGFVCRQETSSVDQTGWHGSTEHRAAVDKDVFMTVWVGDIFCSTLPWPGAFNVFISGQVGSNQVCMEAWEAQDGPDWEETYHELHCTAWTLL